MHPLIFGICLDGKSTLGGHILIGDLAFPTRGCMCMAASPIDDQVSPCLCLRPSNRLVLKG